MIGHCALRYYVMGERALDPTPPSAEELAAMRSLVAEAIDAGAVGFSTSRSHLHRVPDGREVPGTFAPAEELAAIASVLAEKGRGTIEVVPRLGERDGPEMQNSRAEMAWMTDVSRRTGRPLTFAITQSDRRPGLWSWAIERAEEADASGAHLRPQTAARCSGLLFGLANRTPYDHLPGWAELQALDLRDRLAVLDDEHRRERLIAEADVTSERAEFTTPRDPAQLFVMPPGPARYDLGRDDSLAAHAERLGVSPAAAFVRLARERRGELVVYYPVLNQSLDAVAEMLRRPQVVLGLADAGAHVGLMSDYSQTTFFLTYWVRERELCPIGEAVRRMTSDGAALFGLHDRGALRPGAVADLNVIDLDGMSLPQPLYVRDFPRGAGRYVQNASGYDYTLVNGEVCVDHGERTGVNAGRVVRPTAAGVR
jgi:N-acyl-D-aspartate/D-glutamate deacylase